MPRTRAASSYARAEQPPSRVKICTARAAAVPAVTIRLFDEPADERALMPVEVAARGAFWVAGVEAALLPHPATEPTKSASTTTEPRLMRGGYPHTWAPRAASCALPL